jgi:pilus assembly protein CpaE
LTQQIAVIGPGDRQLEQLLRSRGLTVVSWMERDLAAKALQASAAAHFVMIDLRDEPRMPSSLESFCRQHPAVPVLLLVSSLDPAVMLDAMRAGVKECLQYPFTVEELDAALARLAAYRETGPGGDVFAFLGAKGGVGTTTAAVNVATDLSLMNAGSVLLIDLHLAYGDAAIYLGAEPKYSIADAIENTHRLDGAFLKSLCVKTKAGPELLASPDRNLALPVDAGRVRTLIDAAARYYRFVVLDLCRTDPAVLDGLDSVKKILVIANQELATVRAASRMSTTLNQRYGKDRVALAVSRYDPNAGIGQSDIERVTGSHIDHLIPSDYRVALEALNTGRPLALSNQTRLAGSLKVLARELANLPVGVEPQKGSRSIFGRLTGRS